MSSSFFLTTNFNSFSFLISVICKQQILSLIIMYYVFTLKKSESDEELMGISWGKRRV